MMRVTRLILALVIAGALAALAQEGAVETVKEGAKKAGEKIKQGAETVGEKTKKAAETVGQKTKETAQTVGRKTKEAVETTGEKTTESTKTAHHKSKGAESKNKAQAIEQQSTNQEPMTPTPSPGSR
jgi:hypothetical protein